MCSQQEWEGLRRRFQEPINEVELRQLVADAVTCIETIVEELKSRARAPGDANWASMCGRRSRTEWVA
jgi:hypothetical protein